MEGNNVQHVTVMQDAIQDKTVHQNTTGHPPAPLERSAADEYDGHKISEMADNVFIIGIILSVVLGFIVWNMIGNLVGVLVDVLVIVAGSFLSRGLSVYLKGYAQLIHNSAEQTKILKRMEQERAVALLREAQAAAAEATAAAEVAVAAAQEIMQGYSREDALEQGEDSRNDVCIENDDIDEVANRKAVIAIAEETLSDEVKAKIFAAQNSGAKKLNPFIPAQEAVETDNFNRIAVFSARYGSEVKCPICRRRQSSKDDKCQLCGCRFIFVDNDKKTKKSNGLASIFSSRKKAKS